MLPGPEEAGTAVPQVLFLSESCWDLLFFSLALPVKGNFNNFFPSQSLYHPPKITSTLRLQDYIPQNVVILRVHMLGGDGIWHDNPRLRCFGGAHLQPGRFQMRLPTTSLGIQPLMFSACTALSDWRWPMELFPVSRGKESFWSRKTHNYKTFTEYIKIIL